MHNYLSTFTKQSSSVFMENLAFRCDDQVMKRRTFWGRELCRPWNVERQLSLGNLVIQKGKSLIPSRACVAFMMHARTTQ